MNPNDVIAFVVLMATLGTVFTAFSPLGRALADRIRGRPRDPVTDPREVEALRDEVAQLRAELDGMQGRLGDVDELQNRLDFAERLLGQARERGLLGPPKER